MSSDKQKSFNLGKLSLFYDKYIFGDSSLRNTFLPQDLLGIYLYVTLRVLKLFFNFLLKIFF